MLPILEQLTARSRGLPVQVGGLAIPAEVARMSLGVLLQLDGPNRAKALALPTQDLLLACAQVAARLGAAMRQPDEDARRRYAQTGRGGR